MPQTLRSFMDQNKGGNRDEVIPGGVDGRTYASPSARVATSIRNTEGDLRRVYVKLLRNVLDRASLTRQFRRKQSHIDITFCDTYRAVS